MLDPAKKVPIAFDGQSEMEVDFVSLRPRLVVELDGEQHLSDAQAYRRTLPRSR